MSNNLYLQSIAIKIAINNGSLKLTRAFDIK